jgi:hypothetical protein
MAPTTPVGPPDVKRAGDTWIWKVPDHTDYPQADGWALTYEFNGPSLLSVTPTFQTSGDDVNHWLTTVSQEVTDDLAAGTYTLVGRMTLSGTPDRIETVFWNPAFLVQGEITGGTALDFQTHAEKTLALIESILEGKLTKDLHRYTIAGRSVEKIPLTELMTMRGTYAAMVRSQKSRAFGRDHKVRFPRVR